MPVRSGPHNLSLIDGLTIIMTVIMIIVMIIISTLQSICVCLSKTLAAKAGLITIQNNILPKNLCFGPYLANILGNWASFLVSIFPRDVSLPKGQKWVGRWCQNLSPIILIFFFIAIVVPMFPYCRLELHHAEDGAHLFCDWVPGCLLVLGCD